MEYKKDIKLNIDTLVYTFQEYIEANHAYFGECRRENPKRQTIPYEEILKRHETYEVAYDKAWFICDLLNLDFGKCLLFTKAYFKFEESVNWKTCPHFYTEQRYDVLINNLVKINNPHEIRFSDEYFESMNRVIKYVMSTKKAV